MEDLQEKFYAILHTDGELKVKDIRHECTKERWVPITCFKENEKPTVILAVSQEIAKNFSKRNLPKNWLNGAVELAPKYLETITNNGWNYEILEFPRKLQKPLEFVVLELEDEPPLSYKKL